MSTFFFKDVHTYPIHISIWLKTVFVKHFLFKIETRNKYMNYEKAVKKNLWYTNYYNLYKS